MAPQVSVIIPCYNAGPLLLRALASVRAQTLTDWEAIIIDDASTDDSLTLLAPVLRADPRLHLLRQPKNSGAGPARNAGIAKARGRFVAFLDADDQWHPEKLARQTGWMQTGGLTLTATAYRRLDSRTGREVLFGLPALIDYHRMLKTNLMGFSTVVYDRTRLGPRTIPDLPRRQDFAFLLGLLQELPHAHGLNEVLTTYSHGHASLSSHKGRAARDTWAVYRQHLQLGLLPSLWYFTHYAGRALLRHKTPALARLLGVLQTPDRG